MNAGDVQDHVGRGPKGRLTCNAPVWWGCRKLPRYMCGRAIKPVRPLKWHKSFHWSFLIRHLSLVGCGPGLRSQTTRALLQSLPHMN